MCVFLIHTSFIFMVKARLILFCDFSGFPWYCFDMRSCSLRVQPPTARICRVKYSLSSGAELMVNGCHSCGPKEEKWVIGYFLSEQHILTPIDPKYKDWFYQILRRHTNCFEIQKLQTLCFMQIFANLTRSVFVFWINWCQSWKCVLFHPFLSIFEKFE